MTNQTLSDLASRAYIYGFPLVFNLDQVHRYVHEGVGANPAAGFNTFSHARALAGPADTFVTINNDTVYSMAQIDLSVGPVALHVPDAAGRYYVLQFVDAWTNNFAYVGHRHRRRRFPAGAAGVERRRTGRRHRHHVPYDHCLDRRQVGMLRRRRPSGCSCIAGFDHSDRARRRHPTRGSPVAGSDGRHRPSVLREATTVVTGLPAGYTRSRIAGLVRTARNRPIRPHSLLVTGRRDGGSFAGRLSCRSSKSGHSTEKGVESRSQRLEADAPPLRLQPRFLRSRFARRRTIQDRGPDLADHRAGCRSQGRALGESPLRGGIHHDLPRRSGPAAHRFEYVHTPPRSDSAR
ncbi:hypothetical protein R1CP_07150 [Rhodococcus opacus]|uniref:DUF1254 domain-containing protein n=1 Tax=Rhodococcus opacus TaxID=37919 RepID=A0A1B1K0L7_RHOOP|nr:hypothetical protein R1CP_07150 [Rhodococcus opacus]